LGDCCLNPYPCMKDVIGTNTEYFSQDASNLLFSRPENQETQEE